MTMLGCVLWWLLLGALLGWLASWLVGRSLAGPVPAPIERLVEKPVDRVVEKVVQRVVDRPVEKIVEKNVDNPVHLARIASLESEVALIAGLRSQISRLQSVPPQVVEKIVEKPVDRVVEKVVEKVVVDTKALVEREQQIKALQVRIDDLERQAHPAIDLTAARAAGFSLTHADELEIIEGIGPKIAELLRADGIDTFAALARTAPAAIQAILDKAGPNFRMANPATWPEQSGLAASNQWQALKALQDRLNAGNR